MSATYRFQFRPYSRSFKYPLQTHHGVWRVRRGIILQLTNSAGQVGWGEIAPVEFFGTETIDQALEFCRSLPSEITPETIAQIPASLPACQFGLEAAQEMLETHEGIVLSKEEDYFTEQLKGERHSPPFTQALTYSHLLPTGAAALQAWQPLWQQGVRTFKWKIGVAPIELELEQFEQLVNHLPPGTRLRLDANGGLDLERATQWLQRCDALFMGYPVQVEFLEQPLPPSQFGAMLALDQQFKTSIALDESVATIHQLEAYYQQGWRGIFVVKAAIAGSPERLRQFCQQYPIDVVWSSVFETIVAQHFIKHFLIPSVSSCARAIGFGVNQWFTESHLDQLNFEQLWWSL